MVVTVVLKTINNVRNLVNVLEKLDCNVELISGRYIVNAKSMLGILSLPDFEKGELRIYTDDPKECRKIFDKLNDLKLLIKDEENIESKLTYDISTFGEILIDFTYQGLNEKGQKLFAQNAGGAPANVLVAANKLGANTAFLGKVGNDMHGNFLRDTLKNENVNIDGLVLSNDAFTTLAFVDLNDNGERAFSFARKPGADTMMEKEEISLPILRDSHIFHIGSLSLTDNPSKATTYYAIKKAKDFGSIISYDPNYRASLWESEEKAKNEMRSIIPYVDIMKISDEEITLLTDEKEVDVATEKLIGQGVEVVVITLGSEGAYVATKEGGCKVNGFASEVIDTTGAGDAFWGAFLYRVSKSKKNPSELKLNEVAEFAYFANAVASICVEGFGAIASMPTMEEVEKRIRRG